MEPDDVPTERQQPGLRDPRERADVKIDGLIHGANVLPALHAIACSARLAFLHPIDGGLRLPRATEP